MKIAPTNRCERSEARTKRWSPAVQNFGLPDRLPRCRIACAQSWRRRQRLTVEALTPSARAQARMPAGRPVPGPRRACRMAGESVGFRPRPDASFFKPSTPLTSKRRFHSRTVPGATWSAVATSRTRAPSSRRRTIRLRTTTRAGSVRLRDHFSSTARSAGFTVGPPARAPASSVSATLGRRPRTVPVISARAMPLVALGGFGDTDRRGWRTAKPPTGGRR